MNIDEEGRRVACIDMPYGGENGRGKSVFGLPLANRVIGRSGPPRSWRRNRPEAIPQAFRAYRPWYLPVASCRYI